MGSVAAKTKKHNLELKIGLFITGALIILFFGVLFIKGGVIFRRSYFVKAEFGFVEGIKTYAPVLFCGVNVGEVSRIEVRYKEQKRPSVIVWLKIKEGTAIPEGSRFFINSLSLFGEKYVEIIPPDEFERFLAKGVTVEGITGVPLFNILYDFSKLVKEVDLFIKESDLKEVLQKIAFNIEDASIQVKSLIRNIAEGEGTLGKLIHDESLYYEFMDFLTSIKEGEGTFGKFIHSDVIHNELEEFIKELRKSPWKLARIPHNRQGRRDWHYRRCNPYQRHKRPESGLGAGRELRSEYRADRLY